MDNTTNHSITIQWLNYFSAPALQERGVVCEQQTHSIYKRKKVNEYLKDINRDMNAYFPKWRMQEQQLSKEKTEKTKQQETFSPGFENWKEKQQSNPQIKISHPPKKPQYRNIVFHIEF